MDMKIYDEYVKSQPKCKCGTKLVNYTETNEIKNQELFLRLKTCVDCGKNYLMRNGESAFLSKSEFRRIWHKITN